jgi:cell division protein FtsL
MSVALRKAVVIALGAALVLVFAVSQVFYWEIMESHKAVTELRTTISLTSQESVALLAARDRLLSPQRIKAVAAAKLDLHVPNKKLQVHSF